MGEALKKDNYSVEHYFNIDNEGKKRYEYFFGEVLAMAGGTLNHNRIAMNIALALRTQMKGNNCDTFVNDVRVEIVKNEMYVYPDVVLSCDANDLTAENVICHPSVIVEVLSKSTAVFDLHEKLIYYMKVPSILYYITIEQNKVRVLLHEKQASGWITHLFENLNDTISLSDLRIQLSVAEIYERVLFPAIKSKKK